MVYRFWNRKVTLALLIVLLSAGVAPAQSSRIRLAVVFIPVDSGLLSDLLPDFESQTGYQVDVVSAMDVYGLARNGEADLVISHYGLPEVEAFITEGLGLWPRPVFANNSALIGPSRDPAGIRHLTDAAKAYRRIAETQSPFIVNNAETEKYLAELLWEAAGRPDRKGWYVDSGLQGPDAVAEAARRGGYTVWGLVPFLIFQQRTGIDMEALSVRDPLLERIMISVVVNPDGIPGVNVEGAKALERYLVAPATQARIRAFRNPDFPRFQLWWPVARSNSNAFLTNQQDQ